MYKKNKKGKWFHVIFQMPLIQTALTLNSVSTHRKTELVQVQLSKIWPVFNLQEITIKLSILAI